MNELETFQQKLDTFIKLSRLDKNDNMIWFDLLSKGLLGYIPTEFIWNNRMKAWDWVFIKNSYPTGEFMQKYRNENWTYRYMLNEFHSRKYCSCIEWLRN